MVQDRGVLPNRRVGRNESHLPDFLYLCLGLSLYVKRSMSIPSIMVDYALARIQNLCASFDALAQSSLSMGHVSKDDHLAHPLCQMDCQNQAHSRAFEGMLWSTEPVSTKALVNFEGKTYDFREPTSTTQFEPTQMTSK